MLDDLLHAARLESRRLTSRSPLNDPATRAAHLLDRLVLTVEHLRRDLARRGIAAENVAASRLGLAQSVPVFRSTFRELLRDRQRLDWLDRHREHPFACDRGPIRAFLDAELDAAGEPDPRIGTRDPDVESLDVSTESPAADPPG